MEGTIFFIPPAWSRCAKWRGVHKRLGGREWWIWADLGGLIRPGAF